MAFTVHWRTNYKRLIRFFSKMIWSRAYLPNSLSAMSSSQWEESEKQQKQLKMLELFSHSNKEDIFLEITVQIIILYDPQSVCFWSVHITTRREVVSRQGRRHYEGQDFFFCCCSMNHSQGPRSSLSCSMTHGSLSAPSMNSSRDIWPGTTATEAKC